VLGGIDPADLRSELGQLSAPKFDSAGAVLSKYVLRALRSLRSLDKAREREDSGNPASGGDEKQVLAVGVFAFGISRCPAPLPRVGPAPR
jgi:hypothetical protein